MSWKLADDMNQSPFLQLLSIGGYTTAFMCWQSRETIVCFYQEDNETLYVEGILKT